MKVGQGILIAVVVSLLAGGTASGQSPATGTIEGTVVAAPTGLAVPGARVSIDGTSTVAVTNAGGRFRIDDVGPGSVGLSIEAAGFLTVTSKAQVRAGAATSVGVELVPVLNILERVQVTATKAPLSIGDVAAQTNVIDRAEIESRGDQTLTQAISHVPGAVVSTQLGIFESVMLRGMPRGDPEFTNTLLLVDGVPQTLSNNGARVVALPINDAGSIEIVRGPNSALYGRTAIGGSVNVRTMDPSPTPELGAEVTAGEFDMIKGLVHGSGPLKGWGGYYLSAAKEQHHGYFVNLTGDDYTDGNWALFGKFTFAPDRRSFGSVSADRVVSDNSTPTNEPVIDGGLLHEIDPRFDRFTTFNIPGTNYHQGETRLTLNYARDLTPSARLVEVFGYRDVRHQFIDDGDFIASPFDLDAHTVSMYPFSQDLKERIAYQELRLDVAGRTGALRHTLTAGGSYEHTGGSVFSDFIYNDPDLFGFTINYLTPVIPPRSEWQHDTGNREYHLGITGLFAQDAIRPVDRLLVTVGGRYDRLDLDNRRDGGDLLERTFDAFSPKLSAIVDVLGRSDATAGLKAYGAYSQSFLPPRRPSSLTPADVTLDLRPEEIDNVEGGLKGSLAEGRVSLEATWFRMRQDGVVLSRRQGPFFLPTNAGKLRYTGIETGATFAPSPRVSLFLNASFYHNRFGEFVIQTEDGDETLTGNRLPIAPDHVVNWGLTLTPIPAVLATLTVKHLGSVQTNNDNTFELEPYSVVDAAVTWRRRQLRVTLSAHNLLNTDYYWNGDGETADPGRPRQVLVTIGTTLK